MIRTITLGSSVFMQGIFVKALENGLVRIRIGEVTYDGYPV